VWPWPRSQQHLDIVGSTEVTTETRSCQKGLTGSCGKTASLALWPSWNSTRSNGYTATNLIECSMSLYQGCVLRHSPNRIVSYGTTLFLPSNESFTPFVTTASYKEPLVTYILTVVSSTQMQCVKARLCDSVRHCLHRFLLIPSLLDHRAVCATYLRVPSF